ncbi:MAG: hypothetical protein MHM6MM_005534 [Cercozoa sp. M6MM]
MRSDVAAWSAQDVCQWVQELVPGGTGDMLAAQRVNGKTLLQMDGAALRNAGVTLTKRRAILRALASLTGEPPKEAHVPVLPPATEQAPKSDDKRSVWRQKVDEQGRKFYVHTVTKKARWLKPEESDGEDETEELPVPQQIRVRHARRPAHAAPVARKPTEERGATYRRIAETQKEIYPLVKYAAAHFALEKKGLLSKKRSVSDMLRHQSAMIKAALTQAADAKTSLQFFKNLTGYTLDRGSSKPPQGHLEKLMATALAATDADRDELYMQLVKQTTGNPRIKSRHDYWMLMAYTLNVVPPSERLAPYLAVYFGMFIDERSQLSTWTNYCLDALDRIMKTGAIRSAPTASKLNEIADTFPDF